MAEAATFPQHIKSLVVGTRGAKKKEEEEEAAAGSNIADDIRSFQKTTPKKEKKRKQQGYGVEQWKIARQGKTRQRE
jgi:hypothetical protein